jgi:signal recognition particle subunit SRP19
MRNKNRIILWPAYFDLTKTRKEGRRVSKKIAIPNPKISELEESLKKNNLKFEIFNVSYPKKHYLKTNLISIKKIDKKNDIIKKIADELSKIRRIANNKSNK